MDKTIKIRAEDYFTIKEYKTLTNIPIRFIIQKALKRYFANKKIKR